MKIRPMRSDDIPVLAAWIVAVPLWQRYGITIESISQSLNQGFLRGHLLLTADDADPACGFAWCIPDGAFGRSAYLRLIGVRPDAAHAGIGGQLLAEIEARLSCSDLFLLVSDFNHDAQHFYQRHGFQQIGAISGYVLSDVTELIFRKRLEHST